MQSFVSNYYNLASAESIMIPNNHLLLIHSYYHYLNPPLLNLIDDYENYVLYYFY